MFHYHNVSSNQYPFFSNICNTVSDKWYILTCYCKKNITIVCILLHRLFILICMGHTLIKPDIVCCMDFTISDARYAFFTHFISLNTCTSIPVCCNISQLLPFNAYGIPPPFKSLNDNNLSR